MIDDCHEVMASAEHSGTLEGIRVNAVAPGVIETGLHEANGEAERLQRLAATMPMQRAGLPTEVSRG
jgi:NAD(P)-dependent dehydrogenase (short-subunit alcohol dehydrogenase family)